MKRPKIRDLGPEIRFRAHRYGKVTTIPMQMDKARIRKQLHQALHQQKRVSDPFNPDLSLIRKRKENRTYVACEATMWVRANAEISWFATGQTAKRTGLPVWARWQARTTGRAITHLSHQIPTWNH